MKRRNFLTGLIALTILATPSNEKAIEMVSLDPIVYEMSERYSTQDVTPNTSETSDSSTTFYTPSKSDVELLAKVIYWDGSITSDGEKIGLAYAIANRLHDEEKRFGNSLNKIINPYIITDFNPTYVEHQVMNSCKRVPGTNDWLGDNMAVYNECYEIAEGVLRGKYPDPTGGATHYALDYVDPFSRRQLKQPWKRDKMETIGRLEVNEGSLSYHKFYREM
jgi:hypothetical protein